MPFKKAALPPVKWRKASHYAVAAMIRRRKRNSLPTMEYRQRKTLTVFLATSP
ncbi:hypothetical protein KCP75_06340 [Salmonella enterica subsp. enterica]|nr:hypothetical protein KCP75_06340 [Salmonella enterica subsp. enterica]